MADDIYLKGKRSEKGERMTKGTGWRLAKITGKNSRVFVGTLLETINIRNGRLAIFSVPVRNSNGKDKLCPKCKGFGCKACKDSGFVSKA